MPHAALAPPSSRPVWRALAPLLLLCIAAGCQTTGDPRQGGLFGWSEDKARERQDALARENAASQGKVDVEKARAAQLQGQQSGLQTESTRLQAEINQLLSENSQLERALRDLMAKRRVGGDELARLQQLLAANARTRQTAQAPAAGPPRPTAVVAAQSDAVNQQNQRLQREVMILMQR